MVFLLIIPLLILRYGMPIFFSGKGLSGLDYFPPRAGRERIALKVYFITNPFLIFSPLFSRIMVGMPWIVLGSSIYLLGICVLGVGLFCFSAVAIGLAQTGIYRFSRNPIYMGYFLIFIGSSLLIGSWFHLAMTFIYRSAEHFLIQSEERWCANFYGQQYLEYQKKVHCYI